MPLPANHEVCLRPLLQLVADGATHKLSDVREELADQLGVTPEEKQILTPTGGKPLYRDRMDWARTDLVQAGLLEAPRRGHIVITPRGRDALATGPADLDRAYLKQSPEFEAFLGRRFRDQAQTVGAKWFAER